MGHSGGVFGQFHLQQLAGERHLVGRDAAQPEFDGGLPAVDEAEDLERGPVAARGGETREIPVADFATVSNLDDPANWFSLWF